MLSFPPLPPPPASDPAVPWSRLLEAEVSGRSQVWADFRKRPCLGSREDRALHETQAPLLALLLMCCMVLGTSWPPLSISILIELETVGLTAPRDKGKWAIRWEAGGVYFHGLYTGKASGSLLLPAPFLLPPGWVPTHERKVMLRGRQRCRVWSWGPRARARGLGSQPLTHGHSGP